LETSLSRQLTAQVLTDTDKQTPNNEEQGNKKNNKKHRNCKPKPKPTGPQFICIKWSHECTYACS